MERELITRLFFPTINSRMNGVQMFLLFPTCLASSFCPPEVHFLTVLSFWVCIHTTVVVERNIICIRRACRGSPVLTNGRSADRPNCLRYSVLRYPYKYVPVSTPSSLAHHARYRYSAFCLPLAIDILRFAHGLSPCDTVIFLSVSSISRLA